MGGVDPSHPPPPPGALGEGRGYNVAANAGEVAHGEGGLTEKDGCSLAVAALLENQTGSERAGV